MSFSEWKSLFAMQIDAGLNSNLRAMFAQTAKEALLDKFVSAIVKRMMQFLESEFE